MKKLSSNIVALLHILVWACFVGFFWIGGDNLLEELYQVLFYYILQPFSALIFGIRIGRRTKAPTKWLFVPLAILLGILLDYLTSGLWYRIYEQYSPHLEWFVGWFSGSGALIGLLYGTFCPPVSKWKHSKRWVTILAAILCAAAVAACAANPTSDRGIAFIPDGVSSVMDSYLETCKNHPETIPSHLHFEYADEQEAYEKSYRKIVDYEILGAEKINDDLYAFTLRLEKEDDTHQKRYYFVGMIDGEWCVMLNSYNIPERLQEGFDKDRFTLTSEDLDGGILVSPENSESFQHDDPVLAVYHGFEVTESMVDYQQKMDAQRDPALRQNRTDKEIVDSILIGRMLLEEAENLGLTATQEECDEMIASAKAAYALPEGKQMLDDWCADMGTTIDAYWAQLAAEAPDTIRREKVRSYINDSYRADHPNATDEEVEKAFADYRMQLLQSHLDEIQYYT